MLDPENCLRCFKLSIILTDLLFTIKVYKINEPEKKNKVKNKSWREKYSNNYLWKLTYNIYLKTGIIE